MEDMYEQILHTEYSEKFDDLRKKAMVTSYYKYGPMVQNYDTYKCMHSIENLKIRLDKYIETGNTEFLVDVANFAMIEFMYPSIEGAKYEPTDSGVCKIAGISVNELRNYDK